MELTWMGSNSASALHLTDMARYGRTPADDQLTATATAGLELWNVIGSFGDDRDRIWGHLLGLCASLENNRQLSEVALQKAMGGDNSLSVSELAAGIGRVEDRLRRAVPTLADQLVLRLRPLMAAWEARGPGLLHQAVNLTESGLLVDRAQVVGVLPVGGGHGRALLAYNHVHIEAVLADVDAVLPEVLRLAWLLLQLNIDLPQYSEDVHRDRLPVVAALAMVPVTLAAGECLGLVQLDDSTLLRAVDVWCADVLTVPASQSAAVVRTWWDTYRKSGSTLGVAVTALDRLLENS